MTNRLAILFLAYSVLYSAIAFAFDEQPTPLNTPNVEYPIIESPYGLEADCEGRFDLSDEGLPVNIEVNCTHPAFVRVTKRAIASLRYLPKDATPPNQKRTDYYYPLLFRLDDSSP